MSTLLTGWSAGKTTRKQHLLTDSRYDEDKRVSEITKKITFKIISSLFTLIAQILIEKQTYDFVSLQVMSNVLTSAVLNYTLVTFFC